MKFEFEQNPYHMVDETTNLLLTPQGAHLIGELNEESGFDFRMEFKTAEAKAKLIDQPFIPIWINSPGGDVYELLACMDVIRACSLPVATIVEGKAMSAGAIIASIGTIGYRFCTPNSTYLIHQVSSGLGEGTCDDFKAHSQEIDRVNERIWELTSKHCGHKKKNYFTSQIKKKNNTDWFLDSESARKHKIVDHVGVPTVKVKLKAEFELIL